MFTCSLNEEKKKKTCRRNKLDVKKEEDAYQSEMVI
jgi:hypothetical protein